MLTFHKFNVLTAFSVLLERALFCKTEAIFLSLHFCFQNNPVNFSSLLSDLFIRVCFHFYSIFFLRFSVRVFLSIIYCVKPFIEHETMSEKGTRLEICSNFSQKSVGIISECHFQHDNKLIPFFLILICHSTITVIFSHFLTSKKETLK